MNIRQLHTYCTSILIRRILNKTIHTQIHFTKIHQVHNRSSRRKDHILLPRVRTVNGERTIIFAGVQQHNKLPKEVKNALMFSDPASMEKKQNQCSVCTINLNAERSLCKSCRCYDVVRKGSIENGDYEPEKDFGLDTDIPNLQLKNTKEIANLACGDRKSGLTAQEINVDGNKFSNEKDVLISHKELYTKKSSEIYFVEYKNSHYHESKSSISTNTAADNSKNKESKEDDEVENCDKDPRPVVCPVTICSKIVTIDSFMLHFLFDHSKVPRTTLDDMVPQEVILKPGNFSTEVQCVASFIMETRKSPSQTIRKRMESTNSARNSKKYNKLLLLLAVRLPICSVKLPSVKCDPSAIFTRSIHTQTDKTNEHCSGITTDNLGKAGGGYKPCTSKSLLDDNEVFILWLCKLDEAERVFSVTLLGEDKRRGYCYIGDAVHVRDKQDPSLLYDKSECLVIKGSAVNQLFNPKGHITAIVSHIG